MNSQASFRNASICMYDGPQCRPAREHRERGQEGQALHSWAGYRPVADVPRWRWQEFPGRWSWQHHHSTQGTSFTIQYSHPASLQILRAVPCLSIRGQQIVQLGLVLLKIPHIIPQAHQLRLKQQRSTGGLLTCSRTLLKVKWGWASHGTSCS